MLTIKTPEKFQPGQIVATPGLLMRVPEDERNAALQRHLDGDWGVVSDEDQRRNDWALINGERLFSAYLTAAGTKFWIITERDRSATTLLLPDEY